MLQQEDCKKCCMNKGRVRVAIVAEETALVDKKYGEGRAPCCKDDWHAGGHNHSRLRARVVAKEERA